MTFRRFVPFLKFIFIKRIDVINATDFSSQFIQKLEGYNDFDKLFDFIKLTTLLQSNGFQHYLGTQDQDSDEDSRIIFKQL